MKELVIDHLCTLLAYNVRGDLQFKNRFNGFVGELAFNDYMKQTRKSHSYFDGGMFLSTKHMAEPLDNPVYFTTSPDDADNYTAVYQKIARLQCKNLYFIQWDKQLDIENWRYTDVMGNGVPLLTPACIVFRYKDGRFVKSTIEEFVGEFTKQPWRSEDKVCDKMKRHFAALLKQFDYFALLELYVQRFVFDDNLSKGTGVDVYYMVRQITDRDSREFMAWRCISMDKFMQEMIKVEVKGGSGMRATDSDNPTYICPESSFKTL